MAGKQQEAADQWHATERAETGLHEIGRRRHVPQAGRRRNAQQTNGATDAVTQGALSRWRALRGRWARPHGCPPLLLRGFGCPMQHGSQDKDLACNTAFSSLTL
eukprot:365022-Chlamydomonas_euryale.AAC.2